jgi:hypothetical protein
MMEGRMTQIDQRKLLIAAICADGLRSYDLIEPLKKRKLGHWVGGFADHWTWNGSAVSKLTTPELEELYLLLQG